MQYIVFFADIALKTISVEAPGLFFPLATALVAAWLLSSIRNHWNSPFPRTTDGIPGGKKRLHFQTAPKNGADVRMGLGIYPSW